MDILVEIKFIINRYDHYFETINSKSNIYLAVNALIIGAVLTGYPLLNKIYSVEGILQLIPMSILLLNLTAIIFTLLAIKPFHSRNNNSLIYFNSIAEKKRSDYIQLMNKVDETDLINDSILQIHELSIGLKKKFKLINWATIFVAGQLFLILLFAFILIFKY